MGMIKPVVFPFLPPQVDRIQDARGWLVRPDSTESLQQVMRQAGVTHTPLCPEWGVSSVAPQAILLDLSHLNQVIRLRHEELMVTVQTGISLGALQAALNTEGYHFPYATSATRPLYSWLADTPLSLSETAKGPIFMSVTGIRVVVGDGESIHYGGEVVKNVTGYDLRHLFMGTHHQYGILTQATLKIAPIPEQTHTMLFFIESTPDALQRFTQMGEQLSHPTILALFRTKMTFGWHILTQVAGYRQTVQAQAQRLSHLAAGLPESLQNWDAGDKTMAHWVPRLDWTNPDEPDSLVLRVALPHTELLAFDTWQPRFSWLEGADICLPWGVGQMMLRWISVNMPYADQLEAFKTFIEAKGGFLQIVRVPNQYAIDVASFNQDPQPTVKTWMARLKTQYNPHDILPSTWPLATAGKKDSV